VWNCGLLQLSNNTTRLVDSVPANLISFSRQETVRLTFCLLLGQIPRRLQCVRATLFQAHGVQLPTSTIRTNQPFTTVNDTASGQTTGTTHILVARVTRFHKTIQETSTMAKQISTSAQLWARTKNTSHQICIELDSLVLSVAADRNTAGADEEAVV
jgi:hypothetical protein